MADDAGSEAAQGTAEDGPLSSRLESKAWKTRMDAYDELTKVYNFSSNFLANVSGIFEFHYLFSVSCGNLHVKNRHLKNSAAFCIRQSLIAMSTLKTKRSRQQSYLLARPLLNSLQDTHRQL